MRPCSVCGNDIPDRAHTCPFCERPQQRLPARARGGQQGVPTINVKLGLPTVATALQQLENALRTHRLSGSRVVRVVHGWGSTGQGGAIGAAVRKHLGSLRGRGAIRGFVAGEDYSEFNDGGRGVLERHAALRSSFAADRLNRGITIVEL